MMPDCGLTNIQAFGDVPIPQSLTDEDDDLTLTLSERGDLGGLGEVCGAVCGRVSSPSTRATMVGSSQTSPARTLAMAWSSVSAAFSFSTNPMAP